MPRHTTSLTYYSVFPPPHFSLVLTRPVQPTLSRPCWLSCSCLLLVRSVVSESQWVQAVHSVLQASQWELNSFFHFLPVSSVIRNFGLSIALLATCFHAGFLLGLFFDPDDGSDMFLRNVGWLSTDYAALYTKIYYFFHELFIIHFYI
jgi:hypothetical protein